MKTIHYLTLGVLLLYFFCSNLYAQITPYQSSLNSFAKEQYFLSDTSYQNLLEFPIIGLHLNMNSDPGIQSFFTKNQNNLIIDFTNYLNSIDVNSHHFLDVKNTLLYYAY